MNSQRVETIEVPGIKKKLFPFQYETVCKMEKMESGYHSVDIDGKIFNVKTDIGILANTSGSGKTLSILALCKRNLPVTTVKKIVQPLPQSKSHVLRNYVTYEQCEEYEQSLNNLIVVPTNIYTQWVSQLKETDLKFFEIRSKASIENFDKKTFNELKEYDVFICTNTYYSYISSGYVDNYKWARVIIDEADNISKIKKDLNRDFLWFVTSTPALLKIQEQNSMIRKMFNNSSLSDLDFMIIKQDVDIIMENLREFRVLRNSILCKNHSLVSTIARSNQKNIINLVESGMIQEAAKILSCNVNTKEELIKKYNESEKIKENENLIVKRKYDRDVLSLERLQKTLESSKVRMNSLVQKLETLNVDNCSICLDKFENPVIVNCCKNIFCFKCVLYCLNLGNKCAFCRSVLTTNNISFIVGQKQHSEELLDKFDQCVEIIKDNPYGKFLVFSLFSSETVSSSLDKANLSYYKAKGGVDAVNRIVKKYNNKTSGQSILLINRVNSATGLNLQETTDIIFTDKVSRELEKRVIGRALNLGREKGKPLNIHYLNTPGSI